MAFSALEQTPSVSVLSSLDLSSVLESISHQVTPSLSEITLSFVTGLVLETGSTSGLLTPLETPSSMMLVVSPTPSPALGKYVCRYM